jgi:plasmid stability protein
LEFAVATLYAKNVPDDVYGALRNRAKSNHRSVSAEVRALWEQVIPTEKELRRRRKAFMKLNRLRFAAARSDGTFPTSEEMIREDRDR